MSFSTRLRRRLGVAAIALAATTAATLASGPGAAQVAPQLPRLTTTGNDFGTFGDHDYCRGAVGVGLTSPRRGVVTVTLRSHGFTGQGAGWARNPKCRVLFIATHTSATGYMRDTYIPATFGRRAGETVSRDIRTGSGLVELGITPYAKNVPVRAPQGYGWGAYFIAP